MHEAYLRLAGGADPPNWNNRLHFYAAAAEAMRRVLIDNARKNKSQKRGGERLRVEWHDNIAAPQSANEDLLAIEQALTELEKEDAESAQLVKLRFYPGLSVEEAANVMGLSRATIYRTWNYCRSKEVSHLWRCLLGLVGPPGRSLG